MSRTLPLLIASTALVVALVALMRSGKSDDAPMPVESGLTSIESPSSPTLDGPQIRTADLDQRIAGLERRLADGASSGAALSTADRALLDELAALLTPATRDWLRKQTASHTRTIDVQNAYVERLAQDAARAGMTVEEFQADASTAMDLEGSFDERVARVEGFIGRFPNSVLAYEAGVHLGIALRWKKRNTEAEQHYRRVIDAAGNVEDSDGTPLRAKALFRLTGLLIDEGRLSEAEGLADILEKDHASVRHPLGSNTYARITRTMVLAAKRKK